MYSHVTTLSFTVIYEKIELLKGHLLSFVVSYHLFVFFNNANTVSAEMWAWGFGNHAWYKSLVKSLVFDSWHETFVSFVISKTPFSHFLLTVFTHCSISLSSILLIIEGCSMVKQTIWPSNRTFHTKVYFNEVVANVLRDNIGIVNFDLRL